MTLESDHELAPAHVRPAIDGSDIDKLIHDHVPQAAAALASAFETDPVMNYVFPRDSLRRSQLERGFDFYLRKIWLRHEHCYTTDGRFGAALWLPPGQWQVRPLEQLRLLPGVAGFTGRDVPRLLRVLHLMETRHPEHPEHFYLAVLGVEPAYQGRGFGTALLRPVLERCDRERTPAYLEASTARNRALYERNGFTVVEELQLPKGGPPIWRMWREPAAGAGGATAPARGT